MTRPRKTRRITIAACIAAALIGLAALLHGLREKPFDLVRVIRNPSPLEYYSFGDILLVWEGKIFVRAMGFHYMPSGVILAVDYASGEVLYSFACSEIPVTHLTAAGEFLMAGSWALGGCRAHLLDANTGQLIREMKYPRGKFTDDNMGCHASVASNEEVIAVGHSQARVVQLFDAKTGNLLQTIRKPIEEEEGNSNFGQRIAIEGRHLVILDPYLDYESKSVIYVYDLDANQFRLRILPQTQDHFLYRIHVLDGTIHLQTKTHHIIYDLADGALLYSNAPADLGLTASVLGNPRIWQENKPIFSDTYAIDGEDRLFWVNAQTGEVLRDIECPLPGGYAGPFETLTRGNISSDPRFGSTLVRNGNDLLISAPGFSNGEGAIFVLRAPKHSAR